MSDHRLQVLGDDEADRTASDIVSTARSPRAHRWVTALVAVTVALVVFGFAALFLGLRNANERGDRFEAELGDVKGIAQALATQVEQLGQEPVVEPPSAPPESIPEVPPTTVPVEPSAADLDAAVARYCAGGACAGPAPSLADVTTALGAYLAADPPVTMAEINTAVADYYAANPPPPGPAGETGPAGPTGETGQQGEPGPPPTQEQIAEAVATYCAAGACAGRGIVSGPDFVVNGGGDCVAQTTYDDGSMYESQPVNPIVCIPPD